MKMPLLSRRGIGEDTVKSDRETRKKQEVQRRQPKSSLHSPSTAAALRAAFGHVFRRPRGLHTWIAWNGGAVRRIAEHIYAERLLPEGTLDMPDLPSWQTP